MKPTEDQIKQINERRAERDKRRDAILAKLPTSTAYDVVAVARDAAWDMLFADDDVFGLVDDANEDATLNATTHTLAMVMVALHAAGVSDPAK